MNPLRRTVLAMLGMTPLSPVIARAATPPRAQPARPGRSGFQVKGTYLNAAFVHPLPLAARQALESYAEVRAADSDHRWTVGDVRDEAAALFARLIGAQAADIAIVPSTMIGENMIIAALGLGPDAGVVTEALHYGPSLALYGELRARGVPIEVVAPHENRIRVSDIERAIGPKTRLIALSLVSGFTGFVHDLKAICELAHSKDVFVYADIIQHVGALPIDVRTSGVDFCCAGGYKWLQGDFGAAFLYVRPEALAELQRPQFGWKQLRRYHSHVLPYDPPGDPIGEWAMRDANAVGVFEVATDSHSALWCLRQSISDILSVGVEAIAQHRRPLMERLQAELPRYGLIPLTPPDFNSPIASFAMRNVRTRLQPTLRARGINVTLLRDLMRVSPSVYNNLNDIEALIEAVRSQLAAS